MKQLEVLSANVERPSLKSRAVRWLRALVFCAMGFGSVAPFTECTQRQRAAALVSVSR